MNAHNILCCPQASFSCIAISSIPGSFKPGKETK